MLRRIFSTYREAFSGVPRAVWLLSVASLVNRSGTMVLTFLTLFLTQERSFTTAQAGQALAVFGVGGVAGSYLGGWLCDKIGARSVMGASLVLTGLGFLVLEHLRTRGAILLMLLALSLVAEAFRPANSAAIAAASTREGQAKSFALYRLAINLGMTLGPAIGGFLAVYDYGWLFRVDGATCLLAAGLLWFSFRKDVRTVRDASATAGAPERSPWRDAPFLLMMGLMFLLALITFQMVSTFPLTLRDLYGFAESRIGLVLAINTLIIVVFEMVLVHSLRERDPMKVVAIGGFLFGLGLALLPFGRGFLYAAFTVAVWTMGEMLTLPVLSGVVANRAGEANRGLYMGLFVLSFEGAFVLAPLTGTWVYQRFGPMTLWLACGVVGVVLWIGFWALSGVFRRETLTPRPPLPSALPSPGRGGD
ncbi:MAG TPA: MFS transporter [Thermoanaerobaculia bacterium]